MSGGSVVRRFMDRSRLYRVGGKALVPTKVSEQRASDNEIRGVPKDKNLI